jgi:hypothetical protein
MDTATVITSTPSLLLYLVIFVIGILASKGGVHWAQRKVQKGQKEPDASVGTAVSSMLALLAFILGFTFSIASSRFSERRKLVVEQANAIGTCYLRTSLLPEPQKTEIRKLFREYVTILVHFRRTADVNKELSKLENIHLQIWNHTASLMDINMDSEIRALFTSSVNTVIDISSERQTVTLVFRISDFLWLSLLLLFTLGMFAIGYQKGTQSTRKTLGIPLLAAAALALVIVMIADMDSTGRHRFQVSQQPLIDVGNMMQKNIR